MYLAAIENLHTVPAVRKLISLMKHLRYLCVEDRLMVPYRLPLHILQLPHPDSLQHCYGLISHYVANNPHHESLLPDYENANADVFDKPYVALLSRDTDLYQCVAFVLIKIKVYVELKKFLNRIGAVLQQRKGRWNNSVVIANILPFIWPQESYLSPAYICRAAGTTRATVGALRALRRQLRGQLGIILPRIAKAQTGDVWRTLVTTQSAEAQARIDAAAAVQGITPCIEGDGVAQNMDVLCSDYIPLLRGESFATLPGVLEVLERYVAGQDY
jgi:hypothetical protein